MFGNVMLDFGLGLIPIVGDLINIAYKANTRNCILLEEHLKRKAGSHPLTSQAPNKSAPPPPTRDIDKTKHVSDTTHAKAYQEV